MKSESLKKEIQEMPPDLIARFLIRMAKFKTENKEFLSYLIYKAYDQQSFIEEIKEEINQQFKNLNKKNLYLSKKTIRKALKTTNRTRTAYPFLQKNESIRIASSSRKSFG